MKNLRFSKQKAFIRDALRHCGSIHKEELVRKQKGKEERLGEREEKKKNGESK